MLWRGFPLVCAVGEARLSHCCVNSLRQQVRWRLQHAIAPSTTNCAQCNWRRKGSLQGWFMNWAAVAIDGAGAKNSPMRPPSFVPWPLPRVLLRFCAAVAPLSFMLLPVLVLRPALLITFAPLTAAPVLFVLHSLSFWLCFCIGRLLAILQPTP